MSFIQKIEFFWGTPGGPKTECQVKAFLQKSITVYPAKLFVVKFEIQNPSKAELESNQRIFCQLLSILSAWYMEGDLDEDNYTGSMLSLQVIRLMNILVVHLHGC